MKRTKTIKERVTHIECTVMRHIWMYLIDHAFELVILACVWFVLMVLNRLPYINLIFSQFVIYTFLMIVGIFLLHIPKKWLLILDLFLFLPALAFSIIGRTVLAESFGNFIYVILWIVCVIYMYDIWKK